MRRTVLSVSSLVMSGALAGAACSGGGDTADPPSPSASPSVGWLAGEYRTNVDLCGAVNAETVRRLGFTERSSAGGCTWTADRDGIAEGSLEIRPQRYDPPKTRLDYSATEEAQYRFHNPPGWASLGDGVPVRGLGDEAKLARVYDPRVKRSQVVIAVRHRNLIFQIDLRQEGDRKERSQVPSLADVEAGAGALTREVLATLGLRAPQSPPPLGKGSVQNVCAKLAGDGARLVPDATRKDISPRGSDRISGCHWETAADYTPELLVEVEEISPSVLTGESGAEIAERAFRGWTGQRTVPNLGDQAFGDDFSFESGRSRTTYLLARKDNVLVYVEYGRWARPSRDGMRREAVRLAEKVLEAHR